MNLISVLASGLPTSEDSEHTIDLELLKSTPLTPHKPVDLFIGVFSTANNFKRRMAVRRTWMQYASVRSGAVAVRFFVGLVSFTFILFLFFIFSVPKCYSGDTSVKSWVVHTMHTDNPLVGEIFIS